MGNNTTKRAAAKAAKAALLLAQGNTAPAQGTTISAPVIAAKRTIQPNRVTAHGVTARSVGGKCSAVWVACAAYRAANGTIPTVAWVKAYGAQHGLNINNVQQEYYCWRKHVGITGRVAKPATPAVDAATTPAAT